MLKTLFCITPSCRTLYKVLIRCSSQSRRDLNNKIQWLCKRGQIEDALQLSSRSPVADSTLSTLLRGSKSNAKMTAQIWNEFRDGNNVITPSLRSHCLALNTLCRDESHWNLAHRIIKEMKMHFDPKCFAVQHWWSLLNALGSMKRTNDMMTEYNLMMNEYPSIKMTKFIIVSLLRGLLHSESDSIEIVKVSMHRIWSDLQREIKKGSDPNELCDDFVVHLFMVTLDRIRHSPSHRELMLTVWTVLVDEYGVSVNVGCICIAITAFSRNANHEQIYREKAMELLNDITDDLNALNSKYRNNLSAVHFRQILTGYAILGEIDKMWSFYSEYIVGDDSVVDIESKVTALNVMASKETRDNKIGDILDIICNALDCETTSDCIDGKQLMSFYRIAMRIGDEERAQRIWSELTMGQKMKSNVASRFWMNGRDEEHHIDSGYIRNCPFHGVYHVEQLMKQIGFEIDCSVAPELNPFAAQKLLKAHSEKKALAICIANGIKDIVVEVDMRMCSDCHHFYCAVSKAFRDRNIQCIDPKGVHTFVNGQCILCVQRHD